MNNTNQDQERTLGIRLPADVRRAIDRAAARELCSASDIARRYMLEGLRRAGLLDEPSA
jgi:hypothetical protein